MFINSIMTSPCCGRKWEPKFYQCEGSTEAEQPALDTLGLILGVTYRITFSAEAHWQCAAYH